MTKTFEKLWTNCEDFHKNSSGTKSQEPIDEMLMKIKVYQNVCNKDIPEEEKLKLKKRLMGEILFSLSQLSLIDNINIFTSLEEVFQYKTVEFYSFYQKES